MSLIIDHTSTHLMACLEGQITWAEVSELRRCLTESTEPDMVNFDKVKGIPTSSDMAMAMLDRIPFPRKPVAFVCANALAFGFARMVATYYNIDVFRIFATAEEALRWLMEWIP